MIASKISESIEILDGTHFTNDVGMNIECALLCKRMKLEKGGKMKKIDQITKDMQDGLSTTYIV